MQWELHQVSDMECTMDDSGVYVTIHRSVITNTVRADLWQTVDGGSDTPLVSFQGKANAVRKHLVRWMDESPDILPFSYEHASYIGYELHRAETTENYVQD